MNNSSARSFLVRLVIVSAVACAGWYFVVRPMRENLTNQQAAIRSVNAEIDAGQAQIMMSGLDPNEAIEELRSTAQELEQLWGVSGDASVLYEAIDAVAHRYGVVVERMEPQRTPVSSQFEEDEIDAPTFHKLGFGIELVGSYEGVARFLRAMQNELGMARIESFRLSPALSQDRSAQVRASVRTIHFQAEGGLAAFETEPEVAP